MSKHACKFLRDMGYVKDFARKMGYGKAYVLTGVHVIEEGRFYTELSNTITNFNDNKR